MILGIAATTAYQSRAVPGELRESAFKQLVADQIVLYESLYRRAEKSEQDTDLKMATSFLFQIFILREKKIGGDWRGIDKLVRISDLRLKILQDRFVNDPLNIESHFNGRTGKLSDFEFSSMEGHVSSAVFSELDVYHKAVERFREYLEMDGG
ncbi:MAG: hypothetical protein AAF514_16520 [Verrucomicrobiota bacterium]